MKEATFSIESEEIVCLIGASGSGKSLLAEALLGELTTGVACTGNYELKIKESESCYIPQTTLALNPLLPINKQLMFFAKNKKKWPINLRELMKLVGLPAEVLAYYPHQLSGGMKKKVLYSFSLIQENKLIIADEPTRGLDKSSRQRVIALMLKQRAKGAALLIITHDLMLAQNIADKILLITQDQRIKVLTTEQAVSDAEFCQRLSALPNNQFMSSK